MTTKSVGTHRTSPIFRAQALTIYALFGDDFRLCVTHKQTDELFNALTLVAWRRAKGFDGLIWFDSPTWNVFSPVSLDATPLVDSTF